MTSATEWEVSSVAQEFDVQLGKRLDAAVNRGQLRWCINNRGVRWGRVLTEEAVQAPLTPADIHDLRLVPGDVLVCEGGEIGRAAVWHGELAEAYFLNTLHRLRSKGRYSPSLLVAFFERWAATGKLDALVGKATLGHLTKENLLRVPLPVMPPAEQERTVNALTDVDSLVGSLERSLAKKCAIKHGMMQELLAGRTRLAGFSGAWSQRPLGSLVDGLAAGTSVRSTDGVGEPAVLKTSAIRGGRFDAREVKTILTQDVSRASCAVVADSLIISRMNTPAMVGDVGYVKDAHPGLYLPDRLWLARSRTGSGTSMRWLTAALSHGATAQSVRGLATGTSDSMKNIPKKRMLSLHVLTPPVDEQHAIADVLGDADTEIEALERLLGVTRAIKHGMIQELLTGRTRLVGEGGE